MPAKKIDPASPVTPLQSAFMVALRASLKGDAKLVGALAATDSLIGSAALAASAAIAGKVPAYVLAASAKVISQDYPNASREALYTSDTSITYLAFTGDILGKPESAVSPIGESVRDLLAIVRASMVDKGIGVPATRAAIVSAATRADALAALAALKSDAKFARDLERERDAQAAEFDADSDIDAEIAESNASLRPATVAELLAAATALLVSGSPLDASVLGAFRALSATVREIGDVEREGIRAAS